MCTVLHFTEYLCFNLVWTLARELCLPAIIGTFGN